MCSMGKYVEGSLINLVGLTLAIIGIILLIGNFVYHDLWVLLGAIILIIVGVLVSAVGRSFQRKA